LGLGAVYAAAALAGRRDGGHWSTACALLAWGTSVVLVRETGLDVPEAAAYLVGGGVGVAAASLLGRSGFDADAGASGTTLVAGGLIYAVLPSIGDPLTEAWPYALLLAVVGIVNLGLSSRRR